MSNSLLLKKNKKVIAYIVPDLGISGGIAVVLNHVNRLKKRGYETIIFSVNPNFGDIDWFSNEVDVYPLKNAYGKFYNQIGVIIATHWSTVQYLKKIKADRKVYFVQSDERRFFPTDENIRKINETYEMDVEYMTEAIWIQRWLKEEFGHDVYYVPNGIDEKIFYPTEPLISKKKKKRVLLEGPIDIWFKGMNESYKAIKDLNCEIWIVSSFGFPLSGWHYNAFFNCVPFTEMNKIYSSCDILLKMSKVEGFFGPPIEAMSCGCAVVVGKVTGYDEYIKDGYNALVVDQSDIEGAKRAVKTLIDDKNLRNKLIENGKKTAKEWNWDRSIDFLEKMIKKEKVEVFYENDFPEKYDYIRALKEAKMNFDDFFQARCKTENPEKLQEVIERKNREIEFIKSSKFWKIREYYIKMKKLILGH